jgi:hypothetical protein
VTETMPVSTANTPFLALQTIRTCVDTFRAEITPQNRSWRNVAKATFEKSGVEINPGYLCSVYSGRRTASKKLLLALGLQPATMPAPVCPVCGVVHVTPWCTVQEGEPTKMIKPKRIISDVEKARRKYAALMTRAQYLYGQMTTAGYTINVVISTDRMTAKAFDGNTLIKMIPLPLTAETLNGASIKGGNL